jgi:FlaA1/EpsC-like NDP-sugar epimerase
MSILRRKEILLLPLMAGVLVSLLLAFLLRFEFAIPLSERPMLEIGVCLFIPAKGIVFYLFRLHRSWWHLVSLMDLPRIILANFCASLAACAITLLIVGPPFPKSIFIMDGVLCLLAVFALQFSVRVHREVLASKSFTNGKQKVILIYGAGSAGLTLAKEIRSNNMLSTKVLGFLDDDPGKLNRSLIGVPILGKGRDAARIVMRMQRRNTRVSEIVIALPSATGRQMRTAIANCRASGVPFRTVPGLAELLSGKVLSGQLREVSVDDLLGRESVQIDESLIGAKIGNKCVMVTGGCGSIGSEICRQIARFSPRKLVIFDQAESDAFMLAMDLTNRFPSLNLVVEIGDIFKQRRIGEVMALHSIEIVFHAAAYKHVPLMEANLIEAVENNIVGTYNVVQEAYRNKVSQLVLISTDKAVNPTSIMGVTKRIAELIVAAMPLDGGPQYGTFVSVRFGNVLASAGSVVQIFKRQIAAGGPVTITHPEMRRYFMSIPEAVQLVLQASTMGKGSELFVLDMGEPVPILDLARNMIRLAGLIPDEDIEIRVTGLRPGEKLFEELRFAAEDVLPTYHDKIKIFRPSTFPAEVLITWLQQLQVLLNYRDADEIKAHLLKVVPEYMGSSPQPRSAKNERLAPVRNSWVPLVLPENTTVPFPFGLPEA